MRKFLPLPVIQYAAVVAVFQNFTGKLENPSHANLLLRGRLNLPIEEVGIYFFISAFLGIALVFFGGILADTCGRRLTWALSLFLHGGGLLWLVISGSLGMALIAAAFIGISASFNSSKNAWLFDHEGRKGLRKGYGLAYVMSLPVALAGIITASFLGSRYDDVPILLAAVVIFVVMGCWVATFTETYGTGSSLIEIAKSGVSQVLRSRVLMLIVVQYSFLGFVFSVNTLWSEYFIDKFNIFPDTFSVESSIISIAVTSFIGLFLLLKRTDYRVFIVYPLICTTVLFFVMPFLTIWQFSYIVESGISAALLITGVGIVLLVNDVISENRATALSFLALLYVIPTAVSGFFLHRMVLGWEGKFVAAGCCCVISLVLVVWAVRIHGRDTSPGISQE